MFEFRDPDLSLMGGYLELFPSVSSFRPDNWGRPYTTLLAVGLVALLCLLPALLNGYPLVFPDTYGYVNGWKGAFPIVPPYYSFAVWLTSSPLSLSFTLLVQGVVAAYVFYLFFREVSGTKNPLFIALESTLVLVLTQLPWVASHIMPDVFAGVGFACLTLLFVIRNSLSAPERLVVFVVAVFAAIVSTANMLVLSPLAAGMAVIRVVRASGMSERRDVARRAASYLAIIFFLALLPNRIAYDRWTIHAPSGAMLFNLLLDGHIAQSYLRDHCPSVSPDVCKYLPALEKIQTREEFLWDGLAYETGAIPDRDGEFARLSRLIILNRVGQVASLVARQTFAQLLTISLAAENTSTLKSYKERLRVGEGIQLNRPGEYKKFSTALQQEGKIRDYYPEKLYFITTYSGYIILLLFLPAVLRTRDWASISLLVASVLFIVLGLVVHGGLVYPQPRYHAKVSWIAWLAVVAISHRLFLAGRLRGQSAPTGL